ncbi:Gfo/Idh/MocA family protein [Vibrio atypicus]|uniref:Gfo/Idh/MocA family protein n=1 Tax=Vibrio atypicus TaxID=558271 RepID=UPI0013569107|nr:Gfo/Idh/MocA family oxidoreductase [Vibrio atypicus]
MSLTTRKIRWGIAGLGNIAQRFATALTQHCEHGELYGVASRSQARSQEFTEQYGAHVSYDTYLEMAQDPNVEAVYIATVHPYHKPLAKLFLTHQKHVLVEKPAFTNLNDWLEMKALAKRQGVLLLEAMKTVTFPAYIELKSYLKEHHIQLTSIEAGFGNQNEYDPNIFIFNPDLSGGATLDVGVYSLWFYYDLCQFMEVPVTTPASKIVGELEQCNVDTYARFFFEGSVKGEISASINRNLPRHAVLKGKNITITIQEKWWNPQVIDIEHNSQRIRIHAPISGNGFEFEIDHFSELVKDGKTESNILLHQVTEQVLSTIESSLVISGFGHLTRTNN